MKRKWSANNVKHLQKWLESRWPDLFQPGPDLKPLSTSIYKEILAYRGESEYLTGRVLREALKRHTTSFGYLYGMAKNTHRYNLAGEAVEPILGEHRAWALRTLRILQKISQKNRKPQRNRGNVPSIAKKSVRPQQQFSRPVRPRPALSNTPAPVIKYRQPKRRIVRPVLEAAVG